ncbi:hypothetical protein Vi05172_g6201 [Venturia inaequalis]|nr:hypothetical protein Vi05172_g6201 [Venturia inaequalis]
MGVAWVPTKLGYEVESNGRGVSKRLLLALAALLAAALLAILLLYWTRPLVSSRQSAVASQQSPGFLRSSPKVGAGRSPAPARF